MSTKKFLFPTDLSELSTAALEYAAALARDSQGELLIVHIEEPGAVYIIEGTDHYGAAMPGSKEVASCLKRSSRRTPAFAAAISYCMGIRPTRSSASHRKKRSMRS